MQRSKSSPFKNLSRFGGISNLILLFILSFSSYLFAGAPDTLWTRTYGGINGDNGYSVQQTSDGGFIIVGTTSSYGAGSSDIYLIRTDSDGDTLWTRTYGGDSAEVGFSIQQTNDNGFVIVGSTKTASAESCYLIRTNSNGDTLWTKMYGGSSSIEYIEQATSVQQTSDGGFILIGAHLSDVYLIRTDAIGDTLWTKMYGGNSFEFGTTIRQTTDEGFIIAGYTYSTLFGDLDVYLIRTNSNGDTLWTRTYGGIGDDAGKSVHQTTDGGFIITGITDSFTDTIGDVYLIRTDSRGDTLWTETYGGNDFGIGSSVQQMSDGGFIIGGTTFSFNAGNYDVYLIRTNKGGDTLWTKTFGGTGDDGAESVQITEDGGFIITGETGSFGDTLGDVYLIRMDKETVGIKEDNPNGFHKLNNFIVSGDNKNNLISIHYSIQYPSSVKLSMYNISGQLVKTLLEEHKSRGEYSEQFKTDNISSGVYYFSLEAEESRYTRKSVVVE